MHIRKKRTVWKGRDSEEGTGGFRGSCRAWGLCQQIQPGHGTESRGTPVRVGVVHMRTDMDMEAEEAHGRSETLSSLTPLHACLHQPPSLHLPSRLQPGRLPNLQALTPCLASALSPPSSPCVETLLVSSLLSHSSDSISKTYLSHPKTPCLNQPTTPCLTSACLPTLFSSSMSIGAGGTALLLNSCTTLS
jgi:hypothetical protein